MLPSLSSVIGVLLACAGLQTLAGPVVVVWLRAGHRSPLHYQHIIVDGRHQTCGAQGGGSVGVLLKEAHHVTGGIAEGGDP